MGVVAAALSALGWAAFLWVAHRWTVALDTPRPCVLPVRPGVAAAVCVIGLAAFGVAVP
ncbi:hypothetical protein ACFRI7_30325 [Streptomyces sp. NPDC056716]|uniref:hypothetical protein n=1 Tax=unclassified Streptomyces TaxID=2593676 RepID=UPI0036BED589